MDYQKAFTRIFQSLVDSGHITYEMVVDHSTSNQGHLHSKLIYTFIHAIEIEGYTAFPEIKLEFEKGHPLNPKCYGMEGRNQWKYKTDVAIYNEACLSGICEVFSIDMVGNYLPMKQRNAFHHIGKFTSADKILHLFRTSLKKPIDFYLVCVLPENIEKKPSYPDVREILKDTTNVKSRIEPQIDALFSQIKGYSKNNHKIIVTEKGIYFDALQLVPIKYN